MIKVLPPQIFYTILKVFIKIHILRINVPDEGGIRLLVITEKQYKNFDIILRKKSRYCKPLEYETLSVFRKYKK